MSVHQELNRTGSTEEQRDDTGGPRTTKQSCPCTHSKSLMKIGCGIFHSENIKHFWLPIGNRYAASCGKFATVKMVGQHSRLSAGSTRPYWQGKRLSPNTLFGSALRNWLWLDSKITPNWMILNHETLDSPSTADLRLVCLIMEAV